MAHTLAAAYVSLSSDGDEPREYCCSCCGPTLGRPSAASGWSQHPCAAHGMPSPPCPGSLLLAELTAASAPAAFQSLGTGPWLILVAGDCHRAGISDYQISDSFDICSIFTIAVFVFHSYLYFYFFAWWAPDRVFSLRLYSLLTVNNSSQPPCRESTTKKTRWEKSLTDASNFTVYHQRTKISNSKELKT